MEVTEYPYIWRGSNLQMNLNQKKFDEILNLLIEKFGDKLKFSEEENSKYLNIKNSNFWMSTDFGEFVVGYGLNHTHFSEEYDNLDEGIIQVFDLLTNRIKTTNYKKGDCIFKTTVDIEYPNWKTVNIGTSSILFYPFWKKTKVETSFTEKLIEKSKIEKEANQILDLE